LRAYMYAQSMLFASKLSFDAAHSVCATLT
jgi:hypothetical protein